MRVAHLTISHHPLDVRIFEKEARTLSDAGHDVHILARGADFPPRNGITFHPLPDIGPTTYFWDVFRHIRTIYRAACAVDADVYHVPDPTLVPVGIALQRRGATVVYDGHEERGLQARTKYFGRPILGAVTSGLWRALERVGRRRLDAFVAATPAVARTLSPANAVLVRNFPLLDEFPRATLEGAQPYTERRHVLAYVGGIQVHLGLADVVAALDRVPRRLDVRFTLMGDFAKAHPGFEAELRSLSGWARVDALGLTPRAEVLQQLLSARIGVALLRPRPEYPEALPTKLFEYMAAGIPVLASDFPQWRELIGGIGCGVTVDPLDLDAVAAAITQLLDDPAAAEEMGRRGRAAVEATYNWGAEAPRLLELYDGLRAPATALPPAFAGRRRRTA